MPLLDAFGFALALLLGQVGPFHPQRPVTYDPQARAVSGWRTEAAFHLDATPGIRAGLLLGHDLPAVTRCVRLDNYWCIKRAGWAGEIAADRDGHVAFASATEGAVVAALLLRRYYVDYRRHSALAIVSHWAPARCGLAMVPGPVRVAAARPDGLATRGVGSTLRARWLARQRHRGGPFRRSVVPDRLIGTRSPEPTIATGLGAAPVVVSATLPDRLATGLLLPDASPPRACSGDATRIQAYAIKAASGIVPSVTADLGLFDAAGRPTANLARLMRNMSAVEIGPLGASASLIAAAVTRAEEVVAARSRISDDRNPGGPAAGRLDEGRRREPRP